MRKLPVLLVHPFQKVRKGSTYQTAHFTLASFCSLGGSRWGRGQEKMHPPNIQWAEHDPHRVWVVRLRNSLSDPVISLQNFLYIKYPYKKRNIITNMCQCNVTLVIMSTTPSHDKATIRLLRNFSFRRGQTLTQRRSLNRHGDETQGQYIPFRPHFCSFN